MNEKQYVQNNFELNLFNSIYSSVNLSLCVLVSTNPTTHLKNQLKQLNMKTLINSE